MIVMYNLGLTLHLHALSILGNEQQQQQQQQPQRSVAEQELEHAATTTTTTTTTAMPNNTNEYNDNTQPQQQQQQQQQESKSTTMFLRARKLYELAFEMHLDEPESSSSSPCVDVSLLFTLALINNLGLVYDVLGETQRSETCFENMFGTMMYLVDSRHTLHAGLGGNHRHEYDHESSGSRHRSGIIEEWDGLLSNVMDILFRQHSLAAAPAA